MSLIELTTESFDDFIEEKTLAVVEFTAKWCAPCQSFAKVLGQVAGEFKDFTFATVDVDQQPALSAEFKVQSVPFVLIIKNATIIYAESGALTVPALTELLEQAREIDVPPQV